MAISLYDASVTSYLQTLDAVSGLLDRGLAHCRANNIDAEEIVGTRIFPDMRPFRFQIQSLAFHSLGAINAIKNGVLNLPGDNPPDDYASLQGLIAATRDDLRKLTPREVNACEGADVTLWIRDAEKVLSAEGFLMSFSLPNFYYHAATAYSILRSKGIPLDRLEYIGILRLRA